MRIRYLETTGRCNADCPYCVDRARNFDMSDEDFYKTVDANIDIMLNQWLWLDFNGEPFMDARIFERVAYLEKRGIKTQFATNGKFLSEKNCVKLVEAGLQYLVVSVVSLDCDLFKQLRGDDSLYEVLDGVKRIKKTVERMNSKMEIQAVATAVPGNDVESFKRYFHSMGVHVAVHQYNSRAGHTKLRYENKRIIGKRNACVGMADNLIVLSDCNVVFCCCDYMGENSIGNLKDYNYSLEKLIGNGKLKRMIEEQNSGLYSGICEKCSDWIWHQKSTSLRYVEEYPAY